MIHYQTWPPQAILVSDWPIKKRFLEINQSETRIACGGHVSEEKILKNRPIRHNNCLW
jgi:hypothetical protein